MHLDPIEYNLPRELATRLKPLDFSPRAILSGSTACTIHCKTRQGTNFVTRMQLRQVRSKLKSRPLDRLPQYTMSEAGVGARAGWSRVKQGTIR